MLVAPAVMDDRSPASTTAKPAAPSPAPSTAAARPTYSSKVSDQLKSRVASSTAPDSTSSNSNNPNRRPSPPQRAWTGAKNPITGRSQTPQATSKPNKPSVTGALRENQRVQFILSNGAEYEGTYANNAADPDSCYLKMVQQKKGQNGVEIRNGGQVEGNMSFQRSQIAEARPVQNHLGAHNDRAYNGNMQKFRTDTAISLGGFGQERQLQRWMPDAEVPLEGDGGLESQSGGRGAWDQFAVAKEKFGMTTDYDENIYTTAINKNAPDYQKRLAIAEKKAREIESSTPMTSHVAEERQADYKQGTTADQGGDEEDKYSRVHRREFPPLQNRENKYTPPARRAPTGHSTVKGAPVDPAIISSQLKKPVTPKIEKNKATAAPAVPAEAKASEPKVTPATGDGTAEKNGTGLRPSATTATPRAISSSQIGQLGGAGPVAAGASKASSTTPVDVQQDVAKEFKKFAVQERQHVQQQRTLRTTRDKASKYNELRAFATTFKLPTVIPKDIITIVAKDPQRQKEIQEKTKKDAEEIKAKAAEAEAKAKASQATKATSPVATKEKPTKGQTLGQPGAASLAPPPASAASSTSGSSTSTVRPTAPQHHSSSPSAVPNRHGGPRQPYTSQSQYPQYRSNNNNNHQGPHLGGRTGPQTGQLGQRLQKLHNQAQHMGPHPVDMRVPPTGPANGVDAPYGRRLSGLAPSHLHQQAKLNPNTQEFRPNAFAPAFNPAGPSQSSSPRSNVNSVVDAPALPLPATGGKLIRRKTKAVDPSKCNILSHLATLKPKVPNMNWDENDGLPPSYTTNPTWRSIEDESKERERQPDSTMLLSYREYFEQLPQASTPSATPSTQHTVPTTAHLHQLPFHLQHPNPNMPPGQSPRMPHMQIHNPQQGPIPHTPYQPNPDDHRMMHSNSAQSFASPRVTPQMQMAYAPNMNSPAPMPYTQPVMQPYMTTGAPQMNPQFRSFSNNPQFMPPQGQHMGGPGQPPFMMQQPGHFMPNGMVPGPGQMPLYGGAPQYMQPPGPGPPPSVAGSNGYPSPGRPAAPMMAHQNSYQGQQMGYGMSPGVHYQQTFVPQPYQPHQPHQHQANKYPQRPQ